MLLLILVLVLLLGGGGGYYGYSRWGTGGGVGVVGLVLIVLGLLALWRGYLRSSILAAFGGLLLGLGATAMLIIYALMWVGQWTPLAAFAAGVFIGLAVAVMRPEAA